MSRDVIESIKILSNKLCHTQREDNTKTKKQKKKKKKKKKEKEKRDMRRVICTESTTETA